MGHCCFVYLDDGISGLPERVSALGLSKGLEIVWLNIEQGKVEVGAYASRAVVGLRY